MRAEDYSDIEVLSRRLDVQHMVREAIVEGCSPSNERSRQYGLYLQAYTGLDRPSIEDFMGLRGKRLFSRDELERHRELKKQLSSFNTQTWSRDFDYELLTREGVIKEYSGDISGLVQIALQDKRNIVYAVTGEIAEESIDWEKHISIENQLRLTSKPVVERFCQEQGIKLEENDFQGGGMSKRLVAILNSTGYRFIPALRTALELRQEEHDSHKISTITLKSSTRSERRMNLFYLVKGLEYFMYVCHPPDNLGIPEGFEIKPISPDFKKYAGTRSYLVPKRNPEPGLEYNTVVIHYMPDFSDQKEAFSWRNTQATCNCPDSLDRENFEVRRQHMRWIVYTMDTHAAACAMYEVERAGQNLGTAPKTIAPAVSARVVELTDYLRNNAFVLDKENNKRRMLKAQEIEILLHEAARQIPFDSFFFTREVPSGYNRRVLKPMH